MLFRTMRLAAVAALTVLAAAGCADGTAPGGNTTILAVLQQSGSHATFRSYVAAAGLNATLSNPDLEITVFAPTDAAFAALPQSVRTALDTDAAFRAEVIQNHIVTGEFSVADLQDGVVLTSMAGHSLNVNRVGAAIDINGASITLSNVGAANGVAHITGGVILPPT